MNDALRFQIADRPAGILVSLDGELDLVSADDLLVACTEALEASSTPRGPVVVDLRQVAFMDSTGLQAVLSIGERAGELGHEFALVRGGRQVQRLLDLTQVSDRITILEEPPAA